ncbi:MAG: hypothetical protein ACI8UO_000136 [Verrucomicrobiales bacterium]|jgi:hypothetical protein
MSLRDLILKQLDGRLSDEEFAELERILEADPDARREYVGLARLDAGLRDEGIREVIEFPSEHRRQVGWGRMLAIAAAIAAVAAPVWIFLFSKEAEEGGMLAESALPKTVGVAVITAESGAVWDQRADADGTLEPGRLVLREGLAQIAFFGGASISLEGPAEIELISSDEAILYRGRLRADVPPAARGFKIRTGDVSLVDLGTSFGLGVRDDDSADIVVFDGEVRATGVDGKPVSLLGGDSAHLLNGTAAPQAREAAGGFPNIESIVAGAGNRGELRYAAWKEASLKLRSDPRLIAYYDFENLTAVSQQLLNRAADGMGSELNGGIVGARVAEGRWSGKTALDFRREGDRVRFDIPGEFEALTLFAWVRIDALDRNLNSLFLTDHFDRNEIHWQISAEGRLHFATSPMGIEELPKNNRRFYSTSFWSPEKSGQWFLLATAVDRTRPQGGGRVRHFVNGEALRFSGGTNIKKPLPVMRIGKADLGNWTKPIWPSVIRTLNGRIDEFAIFNAVLSAAEIRAFYERGKP